MKSGQALNLMARMLLCFHETLVMVRGRPMRFLKSSFTAAAFAAAVCAAAPASATTIDFNGLGGNNNDTFTNYFESGYQVYNVGGSVWVAQVFGNPVPDLFFGTAGGGTAGGDISIDLASAGAFSLTSFDIASNNGSTAVNILGYLNGVQQYLIPLVISDTSLSFSTISGFGTAGIPVNQLLFDFNVRGTSANLDNIVLAEQAVSVPEPLTMSLFGAGLAGMIAARRKKRA
jgi:hypothetical protein